MKHEHYKKSVEHLSHIDVYRVLELWEVTNPAVQHAIKKLLNAGQRGSKSYYQDLQEAIDSIERALEMEAEVMSDAIPWEEAPDWAEWVARDDCGAWYWYDKKPTFDAGFWCPVGQISSVLSEMPDLGPSWNTLRRRPSLRSA